MYQYTLSESLGRKRRVWSKYQSPVSERATCNQVPLWPLRHGSISFRSNNTKSTLKAIRKD